MAPGTVLNDLLSAVAVQVASFDAYFSGAITNAFVSTAVGSALDALALDHGLTRNSAALATGTLTFTRSDTTTALNLPTGIIVSTNNLDPTTNIRFSTLAPINFAPGVSVLSVNASCLATGSVGNIGAGTVTSIMSSVPGILSVTNPSNMSGGTDAEADAALRARIFASLLPQSTVARINAAVLGVSGIFTAATFDQQDGEGNCYVYACDPAGNLSTPLQTNVQSAADSNKSLGSIVTVIQASTVTVNIAYNFAPMANFSAANVQASINAAITAYFSSLSLGATVRPYDITSVVIGNVVGFTTVNGIQDFQLTSPSAFQTTLPWQLPILGNITATQISS